MLSEDSNARLMEDFDVNKEGTTMKNSSKVNKGLNAGAMVTPDKMTKEKGPNSEGAKNIPPTTAGVNKKAPRRLPRNQILRGYTPQPS